MAIILNGFAADVALEVAAGTSHFIASVKFDKRLGTLITLLNKCIRHGLFDGVFG